MKYAKPELSVVGTAVVVIQGGKDTVNMTDGVRLHSIPAYQADE